MTRSLFDLDREELARDAGMTAAANCNAAMLDYCRQAAKYIAGLRPDKLCCSEWVRERVEKQRPHWRFGNWFGSLFKTGEWEKTGKRIQVSHKGGHAREVNVWRYIGS